VEARNELRMNYLHSRVACFLFLIFLSLSIAYAQEYEGRVVSISDGGTLVLLTPQKRQITRSVLLKLTLLRNPKPLANALDKAYPTSPLASR
jgi:hypothetical protein